MSNYEKPKRGDHPDNEMMLIVRHFYLQLFMYLMIPALILAFIFALPVFILNNVPDRLNARCSVYDGDTGIRIISETQRTNITTFYWTDNHGESWHIIETIELPYQSAKADCDLVSFNEGAVELQIDSESISIAADGEIFR